MARTYRFAACAAVALLLLASTAVSQDDAEAAAAMAAAAARPHPLTSIPAEAPGIETVFVFPKHPDTVPKLPAGDAVEVVVGLHNGASQPYNITAIMGSLNSPLDFGIYVQNFTHQTYGLQVEPDSEASVLYSFRPDPSLHPREFTVALTMFYTDGASQMSATTFFNNTIEIVEPPRTVDGEILFLWALLLGAIGFAVYKAYAFVGKFIFKGKSKKKTTAAPADLTTDDWLEGTAIAAERKKADKARAKAASKAE